MATSGSTRTPPPKRSLAEFLAARQPERDCPVCVLAQVQEINATRGKPRHARASCEEILAWLVSDQGVSAAAVTVRALQIHFVGKHHVA